MGALVTAAMYGVNATAREPSVLLLRPAHPTAASAEAIVRLRGELLAAGYEVELADVPDGSDVRAAIEDPSRPAGVDAQPHDRLCACRRGMGRPKQQH